MRSVTVYCSSSRHVPVAYFEAATELGRAVARAGWRLVYGGNRVGCMGALADAARAAGGKVVGVTPRLLLEQGIADELCEELLVTETMRERKGLLEQHADAFIALPGGLGTFEEVFEILVARVLGYHQKPIVLLNIAGYYTPLLAMIEHGVQQRFIKADVVASFVVASTVAETIEYLRRAIASPSPGTPGEGRGEGLIVSGP